MSDKSLLSSLQWRHFHGLAGIVFLILCVVELILFVARGHPTIYVTFGIVLATFPFILGVFTRTFRRRLRRLQHKKFVFLRGVAWTFAFVALMVSVYTRANFFITPDEVEMVRWIGTGVYAIGTIVAIGIGLYEVLSHSVYTDGFLIANLSSTLLLLVMPLLHFVLGTSGLTELYARYAVADAIYMLAMISAFSLAIDNFILGLATSRRIPYARYKLCGGINWGGFYLTTTALLLWYTLNWGVALSYYVGLTLLFLIARRIPLSAEQNRSGFLDDDYEHELSKA